MRRKLLCLWVIGGSNAIGGHRQVIIRMAQLHVRNKQEPIGTRFPERHPHAASIHHSSPADHAIELHVGMTTDDERDVETLKHGYEKLFRRETGKCLILVSRCRVAKQHVAETL